MEVATHEKLEESPVKMPAVESVAEVKPDQMKNSGESMTIATMELSTALTANIKVNDHPARAIVDTGAAISIVSLAIVEKCVPASRITLWNGKALRTANGMALDVVGRVKLTVHVGECQYQHEFAVIRALPMEIILGNDFLRSYRVILDVGSSVMRIGKEDIKLSATQAMEVETLETVILPAKSEVLAIGRVKGAEHCIGSLGMMEMRESLIEEGLSVARTVATIQMEMPVRLVNHLDVETKLEKGTKIGEIEPAVTVEEPKQGVRNWKREDLMAKVKTMLPPAQRVKLEELIWKYRTIFATDSRSPGIMKTGEHSIDTTDEKPVHTVPYRTAPAEDAIIKKEVDSLLKNGLIQKSRSAWSSPVVLAKKKDGTPRFCVDFRKLNAKTRRDVYPLPRINDILDALAGMMFFTALDCAAGYWQLLIRLSDREKTAFITKYGLFEWLVMPFGLTNAPATFQRAMNEILADLLWNICMVYLDDIIVYAEDFESHVERLEQVFKTLQEYSVTLRIEKCHFFMTEVHYLGHVVSQQGIKPEEDKIRAVREMEPPGDVTAIRRFIGMCSYYRRFIEDFATVAHPLHELTRKERTFVWTGECQVAFDTLKQKLTEAPVLAFPRFEHPFVLTCDASNYGIAGILSQEYEGREWTIAYASRSLLQNEKNYSATEKECLAVVWSVKHYRPYLYGQPFRVVTDHSALQWLYAKANPTGRIARWMLQLSEYNFTIQHKPGVRIPHVDALSRSPLPDVLFIGEEPLITTSRLLEEQKRDASLASCWSMLEEEENGNIGGSGTKAMSKGSLACLPYVSAKGVSCVDLCTLVR